MRIHLFRAFPDPYRMSMQIYADHLAQRIRALLAPGEELVECVVPGARAHGRVARYWDQYVRYQRFARRAAGDVNHIIDHGYGHLVWSLPPGRTVVTFHDAIVARVDGVGIGTRLSFRWSLQAMRRAACIVADSHTSRRDFLALVAYPPERVKVVYPGVDPVFRPEGDRETLRRRHGLSGVCLLHVGHTQPYMNVEAVIRTCARLREGERLDVRLVKVGGAFTPAQRALIERLGLGDRVDFRGRVTRATLRELYAAADVVLYPVRYAGFGLPPLEAMACGVPVVCSDRGALPETAGDAALLVDPDDEQGMAERVVALVHDARLRGDHIARGIARAREFCWERAARDLVAIYRELVAG